MARIGLVAGWGELPVIFAESAKKHGDKVIGFGLEGVTDKSLERHVEKMHWLKWGEFKKGLLLLAVERIGNIALLGKIKKELVFKNESELDDNAKKLMEKTRDKKDYAILKEASKALGMIGVSVLDPTPYLKDLFPPEGVMTARKPTEQEQVDIEYGRMIARELAHYDIGQTVAIKDKTVVAIEGAEGTDETIDRAGRLTGGRFVMVKMARPEQDMRFDIPLVGLDTLDALISAGAKALAIEKNRVLMMDREEMVRKADDKDISIVVI